MKPSDTARVTAIIEATAAEEMLPRFKCLRAGDVREKGPGDLVTVVDEACEARLARALTALLPGSIVVGEEGAASDPGVLDRLSREMPVWIIDPLDGTYNFAHGVDRFATIVALAQHGETVAGWIHDPVNDITAMGEAGAEAFIGSHRLKVAAAVPLAAMTGAFSRPRYARSSPMGGFIDRLAKAVGRHINLGSAGIEYLWLANGQAHIGLGGISTSCGHRTTPPACCCTRRPAASAPCSTEPSIIRRPCCPARSWQQPDQACWRGRCTTC